MVLLFLRFFFLLFLRLHLLIGDIGQRELLARWHEPYKGFLNVFLRTESRSFLHSLALERGFERTQIAKVHDIAIGNDVACRFCGKIENCCHFLRIESGRFSHSFAEILEVHTVSSRRLCNLHGLFRLFSYVEFALGQNELQRFVCHNILRSVSSCQPWRAGKPLNPQRQLP